ncbi:MAG: chemotaxis protein CheW [Bryobacteraceae bacterium]
MAVSNDSAEQGSPRRHDERAGKYLAFLIGDEEFGVGVLKVREIMGVQEITSIPQTPPYLKGVINLRGKVVPIVDLRLKFGLPAIEYNQRTCIIVVQITGLAGPIFTGVIVDGVSEVFHLTAADIEDTPDFGDNVSMPYVLGMAKTKSKVRILLDIDQVLNTQELRGLERL